MKFRIFTSMLLVVFLSIGSSSVASAHEGEGDHCYAGWGWGHGWGWGWGHGWRANNYVYGPDGMYAHHRDGKACCDKDMDDKAEEGKKCCEDHCSGAPTYRRAYYHECYYGEGHLSFEGHKCCSDKKEDKDN